MININEDVFKPLSLLLHSEERYKDYSEYILLA